MSSKSRRIGTQGEVRVAKYLATVGWPYAEHRALTGRLDKGDITGTPGLCWQIKAGEYAWTASDGAIDKWLEDVEGQRKNAAADYGILVVARPRKQPKAWRAIITVGDLVKLAQDARLLDDDLVYPLLQIRAEMPLEDMCQILTRAGYGDERRQDHPSNQETP